VTSEPVPRSPAERTPAGLKRHLESVLPGHRGVQVTVQVHRRDRQEHRCAARDVDHYEILAYYTTTSQAALDELESALKQTPGVYLTTQVRRGSGNPGGGNVFTEPSWPVPLGARRRDRDDLRPMVIALLRGAEWL
jgi:hypothetical protein